MLPPLDKLTPHSYNILPPLAAQLLPEQIFYPLWTNYTLTLTPFYPLVSPTLTSFYPL